MILLSQSSRFPDEIRKDYAEAGVELIDLGLTENTAAARRVAAVSWQLWKMRKRVDVTYSHGFGAIFLAHLIWRGQRWVHHHHLDVSQTFMATWSSSYRRILGSADVVVCCTSSQAKLLHQKIGRVKSTTALPGLKSEGRLLPHSSGKNYVVGFASVLKRSKGIDVLMEAAPALAADGVEIRLWGNPYEFDERQLAAAGCRWMGEFSSADLDAIAHQIDVFCLPSRFPEGLPLVVSEMISRGLPVVCSASGGLRDLRGFHELIEVIDNPTPAALREAVARIRARDSEPARRSLRERYEAELSNARAYALLRTVLNLNS